MIKEGSVPLGLKYEYPLPDGVGVMGRSTVSPSVFHPSRRNFRMRCILGNDGIFTIMKGNFLCWEEFERRAEVFQ